MRRYLAILVLVALVMAPCGCMGVAKLGVGAAVPTAGRTKPALSWGFKAHGPGVAAAPEGILSYDTVISYEELRSPVEDKGGLSRGTLRTQTLGMQYVLTYHPYYRERPDDNWSWVGAGPEYHWNSFVLSDNERARASLAGKIYDEEMKDSWGWCITAGHQFSIGVPLVVELTYHWAHTRTIAKGIDNGMPFRRSKGEDLEWLSVFLGVRIIFR